MVIVAGEDSACPSLAVKVNVSWPVTPASGLKESMGGLPDNVPLAGDDFMMKLTGAPSGSVAARTIETGVSWIVAIVWGRAAGGRFGCMTVKLNVVLVSKLPSLTSKVMVLVPITSGDGLILIDRLAPEPPKTIPLWPT